MEIDGEVVIGREGADLTIADPELSRRHARVRPVDGGVEIEDLGSSNGTFVNGQRVSGPVRVTTGASMEVGDSRIALELGSDAPPAAAAPAAATPAAEATAPAEPGAAPARAGGPNRRLLVALAVAIVAVAIAVGAVLAFSGKSEETEVRTLNARVQTLALSDLTSFQVSGSIEGEPLDRSAVVIQRRMPTTPKRGGKPVPVRGYILVTGRSGVMSLNFSGTLRVTRLGGEQLNARGTASNGNQEYEDVKGSFRMTGGRATSAGPLGNYRLKGKLEY
jgi:pSer/pThr/pTyr-binding forkhead associated (FHA) protein